MLKSTTSRLAATYLVIIMIMSIGFSIVFYNTSSRQLGRQIPSPAIFGYDRQDGTAGPQRDQIDGFFRERIMEGRHELLVRLIWLNVLALIAGGGLSWVLARRTLEPIEAAMEAQSRFVSDASHELRTPITALQTTNEVALRKKKLNLSDARELIAYNVDEAVKLKHLSDALLGLLQQDASRQERKPVSLQDLAADAMNQIIPIATEKDITIEDEVPDIRVAADRQMLGQALTILLDNACKYSNHGGLVSLAAHTKGNTAYLTVSDNGIGIHASDIPHIFDRFYRADRSRTKDVREGYGLGLAIAHKIISQHNGEINVQSQPGKGAIFTVKLPLSRFK